VGRNEGDNALLESAAELYDLVLKAESAPGPTVLVPITVTEAELRQAAAICARYSDSPGGAPVAVKVRSSIGERRLEVMPASEEDVARLRI
jgi:predicted ribosome quality control (RQC) complex YloA/Tae2 family protein